MIPAEKTYGSACVCENNLAEKSLQEKYFATWKTLFWANDFGFEGGKQLFLHLKGRLIT